MPCLLTLDIILVLQSTPDVCWPLSLSSGEPINFCFRSRLLLSLMTSSQSLRHGWLSPKKIQFHLCILLCVCIFWNNKSTCPNLLHISDTTSSLDTSNQNHFSVCDPPPVTPWLPLLWPFFFFFLALSFWILEFFEHVSSPYPECKHLKKVLVSRLILNPGRETTQYFRRSGITYRAWEVKPSQCHLFLGLANRMLASHCVPMTAPRPSLQLFGTMCS